MVWQPNKEEAIGIHTVEAGSDIWGKGWRPTQCCCCCWWTQIAALSSYRHAGYQWHFAQLLVEMWCVYCDAAHGKKIPCSFSLCCPLRPMRNKSFIFHNTWGRYQGRSSLSFHWTNASINMTDIKAACMSSPTEGNPESIHAPQKTSANLQNALSNSLYILKQVFRCTNNGETPRWILLEFEDPHTHKFTSVSFTCYVQIFQMQATDLWMYFSPLRQSLQLFP